MAEFQRLSSKKFPIPISRPTPEYNYWSAFGEAIAVKEPAAVTCLQYSPVAPFDLAVCSSTRVKIYHGPTRVVKKSVSRSADVVYSAGFRDDGKLLVTGNAAGSINILDLGSRTVLRTFTGHSGSIRASGFLRSRTHIVSAGEDQTVRLWDIPGTSLLQTFQEHTDYVRACVPSRTSPNNFLSGSYDHTIKFWDSRAQQSSLTIDHGAPVEAVLLFPGDALAISAGQGFVKIWDIVSGGHLLHTLSNFQKTVTSLCFNGDASRLITGSLDRHVKVFDIADYSCIYSTKLRSSVMSVAVNSNNTQLAVGLADGSLIMKKHKKSSQAVIVQPTKPISSHIDYAPNRLPALRPFEKYLRRFRYREALDSALAMNQPILTYDVLCELLHRNALRAALSNRDEASLVLVLQFVLKSISKPQFASLAAKVIALLLDIYAPIVGKSSLVDSAFTKLQAKVTEEVLLQRELCGLLGAMNMISMAASLLQK